MRKLKAFAELIAKPIKRDDNLAVSLAPARVTSEDIERQRRMVGDMVPEGVWDGWEAALVGAGGAPRLRATPEEGHRRGVRDWRDARSGAGRARRAAAGPARVSRRGRRRSCGAAARGDARVPAPLRGAQAGGRRARLPRSADQGARPRARQRGRLPRVPRALPRHPRRRVPGHRSAAGRAAAAARRRRRRRRSVPGALFIVGDPKQSIYRFRRADVGVYRRIAERLLEQRRDRGHAADLVSQRAGDPALRERRVPRTT